MFKTLLKIMVTMSSVLLFSGCVTIVDATSEGPIQTDPGKRTFGEYWDDKQIKTIVAVNLKKASPGLKQSHINVHSFRGVVLLTGEVPSHKLRDLASQTTKDVHLVRQVYNELQVRPKSSFFSRTSDNFLTTKINVKLLAYKDIDSDRVKVIVEDDIVYLMGLLTKVQAEKITQVVRRTGGVKKVVRAIEYVDDQ